MVNIKAELSGWSCGDNLVLPSQEGNNHSPPHQLPPTHIPSGSVNGTKACWKVILPTTCENWIHVQM